MSLPKVFAYVRKIPYHPVEAQEAHHIGDGVHKRDIWIEGRGAESLEALSVACRPGDIVKIQFFRCLGEKSPSSIRKGWDLLKERRVTVIETSTGRNTKDYGVELMHDATKRARHEQPGNGHAALSRNGRKGAKTRAQRIAENRMPDREAARIWWSGLTPEEALEAINADKRYSYPWTLKTAYRRLRDLR